MSEHGFLPFGEYKPDLRYFGNDGLLVADGVIPTYGNYVTSPTLTRVSAQIGGVFGIAFGLHVDPVTGNGYAAVQDRLYEITEAGGLADVSRAGAYSVANLAYGWQGCSFGEYVVMTNYADEVQYGKPGSMPFANLITSTFAPKAKSVFPFGNNLFLGNLNLAAGYDGLSVGANPTAVAWSRNENIQQFGSFNADPQIIGAGYQPLNFDLGEITGGVAGDGFAIVSMRNGLVRVDGPPYTFTPIARKHGCIYPYGMCFAGSSLYMFSPSGLMRLRDGTGEPELLGAGKFVRSLIDNTTGAGRHAIGSTGISAVIDVSLAYDPINDLLFVAYTEDVGGANLYSGGLMAYNIGEDRASYFQMFNGGVARQCRFLRDGRQGLTTAWSPGRDIRFLEVDGGVNTSGAPTYYAKMTLGNSGMPATLQKAYVQFNTNTSTRLLRIRPRYNVSSQSAIEQISVTIESTSKPYAVPTTSSTFSTVDSMGWIATPTTTFDDFHSIKFVMTANANMHKVVEYEGFEYEFESGPVFVA